MTRLPFDDSMFSTSRFYLLKNVSQKTGAWNNNLSSYFGSSFQTL